MRRCAMFEKWRCISDRHMIALNLKSHLKMNEVIVQQNAASTTSHKIHVLHKHAYHAFVLGFSVLTSVDANSPSCVER